MKTEIDKNLYCSGCYCRDGICRASIGDLPCKEINSKNKCGDFHRKWPTLEQYREEYGEDYEGHRPVWWKFADNNGIWRTKSLNAAMGVPTSCLRNGRGYPEILIVCACTPWDRPSADWRPE
jgi:hypothetical protein